jgi:uncharacterized protein (TIGR00251 family)
MPEEPGCRIKVRVQPLAKRTEIAGMRGDAIVVRVAAAPRKGAANKELCRFLARAAGLPRSQVRIVAGERSREKTVHFATLNETEVRRRLETT